MDTAVGGAATAAGGGGARAIVLGAAAGGGFPQWNCRCAICALAWAGDPRVSPRTQASLAVTGDGETWTLIGASPDLGQQIRATPALRPGASPRHSPIAAVALPSAEIDGVAGLLSLRERHAFRLLALPPVHDALAANPVFDALRPDLVRRIVVRPGAPVAASPGVTLTFDLAPGKAPLYLETDEEPGAGAEEGEAAAILVEAGASRVAYVPGCAALPDALVRRLATADVLLFDGTLFTDDEMIRAGVGEKTGRRMAHTPIAGPGGSMDILARLPARRKLYTHLNNTNPVLVEGSPERAAVEAAGFEVAWDGLEIAL